MAVSVSYGGLIGSTVDAFVDWRLEPDKIERSTYDGMNKLAEYQWCEELPPWP